MRLFYVLNDLDLRADHDEAFDFVMALAAGALLGFLVNAAVFAPLLNPGGLLFVGHSENFTRATKHLRLRGKTVYERIGPAS